MCSGCCQRGPYRQDWRITDTAQKKRVVLMAIRGPHCLADLLHRWYSNELDCEISCVISNHDDLRSMIEWHGIAYYYVPVNPQDKAPAFAEASHLVKQHDAEVVVLARYMRIHPPDPPPVKGATTAAPAPIAAPPCTFS